MCSYRIVRRLALVACLLPLGCVNLSAPKGGAQNIYVLDAQPAVPKSAIKRDLVLAVSMPEAHPGFDTPQIAYFTRPYELDYFVNSRWADTPAHMLQPMLMQALEQSAGFHAVIETGSAMHADVRLETELIRLQQDFTSRPSRVQMTLQAQLIDVRSSRVLATQQFDDTENALADDAYGGVIAANRVAQRLLGQVAEFCVAASGQQ